MRGFNGPMTYVDDQRGSHTRPFPDLFTRHIRLRPWDPRSEGDVAAYLRGATDPEVRRWNTPLRPVTDVDGARESLRSKAVQAIEGTSVSYCVTDADTGTPLGHIGVNAIDRNLRLARVGYWVLPEARGRRVASGALALTARWALTDLGLHRLELGHAVGHDASCRVAERCGFRHEGTLRDAMFEAGRKDAFRDVHLHARLASDPDPVPVP